MGKKKYYTDEETKAWRERNAQISAKIRAMTSEERAALAQRCGTITAEGHPLSVFNVCFLWLQAGKVLAQVGGIRQWNRVGRRVKAGQHAIGSIFVPCNKGKGKNGNRKLEDSPNGNDRPEELDETGKCKNFKPVSMFDITQTEEG